MTSRNLDQTIDFIFATDGKLFGVRFMARGNKKRPPYLREMVCRLDVKKHLAGGERAYDPADHDLIWVWEPAVGPRKKGDRGYRSIPLEGIQAVRCGGDWITVRQDRPALLLILMSETKRPAFGGTNV
jgi:hypothetical protein